MISPGQGTPVRAGDVSIPGLLAAGRRSISFEFFPPKTERGEATLWRAIRELERLAPHFVSVTYGAGGTTRERTVAVTGRIAADTTMTPVAHLTCVGSTVEDLHGVIAEYVDAGVHTVLALRGDPPGGPSQPWTSTDGGLDHAVELVELLRRRGRFDIGVAAFPQGHPESTSLQADAEVLAAKQRAGASFAITQFFFRADDYFRSVDIARDHGATLPIIPGIMPVTNVNQIKRFAALSGADFPADLAERFGAVADDEQRVGELGVEIATALAEELLAGGAPGLHFYTLNRSAATRQIYRNLQSHSPHLR